MKELLLSNGWWMYKRCRCGGTLKEKYKHPNKPSVEIWIYPNKGTWEHRVNRKIVNSGTGVQSLENLLNQI